MAYLEQAVHRISLLVALLIVVAGVACGGYDDEPGTAIASATAVAARPADTAPTDGFSANSSVVKTANLFLSSLNDSQRESALYSYDDAARSNWSNLPAGVPRFDRNGVRTGDLDRSQTEAMFVFLASALSADGYETILGIVGADAFLSEDEGEDRFGDYNYWLAFFGEPSDANIWGWQFGGHHLAVNVTVSGGRSYLSPTFVGVEPASYPGGAAIITPLDSHRQAGVNLINSLDDPQKVAAKLAHRPDGIHSGAGQDGVIPPLEGFMAAGMTGEQRDLLVDVIAQWVGMLDSSSSSARLAEIRSELEQTHFSWHDGGGESIYFRVQGPSLIIEFSTESDPGEDSTHYHSIYRNPVNEYGDSLR